MKNNIEKIHKLELFILDKFIEVCDKYNLRWFADSGTLLGAIREGKMIQWDDDIDVVMLREDYNKLLKIGTTEFKSPFFLQSNETDRYTYTFSKLRFSDSTILEVNDYASNDYNHAFNKGIFIDIFVLDAVPEKEDEFTSLQMMMRYIYNYSTANSYDKKTCLMHNISRSKDVFRELNWLLSENSRKYANSKYLANLYFDKMTDYRNVVLYRDDYSSYKEIDFDGLKHKLRIPVGYERILRTWYGDDWKIPKQFTSCHSVDSAFYDTEKSYKEYEKLTFDEYMKLFK